MLNLEKSATFRRLIEEGRKEGEKEAKLAIAKNLLKEGMDIDEIAEITKLPKEEIEKLLN
ncbi:putative transposase/invertase (TIGR01784 family) [Caldanaerobacter subterraneus subsp. tengcongensis MB4]|nr:hypothetical protein [Caldanaerobacter subterraneus]MCS3915146.1 putative transposase/invertase (TIGR01784 family) [Caldanaerobacter subterraneus subsp. tengcongensis MB4]